MKISGLPDELVQGVGKDGLEAVAGGQGDRDMALVAHLRVKVRYLDFSRLASRLGAVLLGDDGSRNLVFPYLARQVIMSSEPVNSCRRASR